MYQNLPMLYTDLFCRPYSRMSPERTFFVLTIDESPLTCGYYCFEQQRVLLFSASKIIAFSRSYAFFYSHETLFFGAILLYLTCSIEREISWNWQSRIWQVLNDHWLRSLHLLDLRLNDHIARLFRQRQRCWITEISTRKNNPLEHHSKNDVKIV